MDTVTLAVAGGIIHQRREVTTSPLGYLGGQVDLEAGYTLRAFFRMMDRYPVLADLNDFLPALAAEARSAPPGCGPAPRLDGLRLTKTVEMIGFPGKPRLEIYNAFHGTAGGEMVDLRPFQLTALLDTELTLGRLRHIVFGDKVDIFEFQTVFNLFEFILALAWELSFLQSPGSCELRR